MNMQRSRIMKTGMGTWTNYCKANQGANSLYFSYSTVFAGVNVRHSAPTVNKVVYSHFQRDVNYLLLQGKNMHMDSYHGLSVKLYTTLSRLVCWLQLNSKCNDFVAKHAEFLTFLSSWKISKRLISSSPTTETQPATRSGSHCLVVQRKNARQEFRKQEFHQLKLYREFCR